MEPARNNYFNPDVAIPINNQKKYSRLAERVSLNINWKAVGVIALIALVVFMPMVGVAGAVVQRARCVEPRGSYLRSCTDISISTTPAGSCRLTASCSSNLRDLSPVQNTIQFNAKSKFELENENGVLTIINKQSNHCTSEDDDLLELQEEQQKLEANLKDTIDLPSGSSIMLDNEDHLFTIAIDQVFGLREFKPLQEFSESTGGLMGLARKPGDLSKLIEKMITHGIKDIDQMSTVEIAFVLDTTASMKNDIKEVKSNLINFLDVLKKLMDRESINIRIALVEYQDLNDIFLNKIDNNFTNNFKEVQAIIEKIAIGKGNNEIPEAALDALLVAKNELSWSKESKKITLLISDAPPHPLTRDNQYDKEYVIDQFRRAETTIAVYPIITNLQEKLKL